MVLICGVVCGFCLCVFGILICLVGDFAVCLLFATACCFASFAFVLLWFGCMTVVWCFGFGVL